MRSLLVALLVLIPTAGTAMWFWLARPAASAASPSAAAPVTPPRAADAAREAPAEVAAITREEAVSENVREATATPPPPPPVQGIEDGGVVGVGADFTLKYGHLDRGPLDEQLTRLESQLEQSLARAFTQRFAANAFTTHAIAPNDARKIEDIVESLESDTELCSSRLVVSDSAGHPTANLRPSAVQIACLPRAEFPSIYSLVEERDWLRNYIERTAPADK